MTAAKIPRSGRRLLAFGFFLAALAASGAAPARHGERPDVIVSPGATAPAEVGKLGNRARTFVPLHSTLIGQGGLTRLNFSGSLSIHNASAVHPLCVEKVEYRSGAGELIETYVTEPICLRPYGSMQIVVAQNDVRAGVGASFTVDWSTAPGADEPLIEAVMASFAGTRSYSFLSPGRRVSRPQ